MATYPYSSVNAFQAATDAANAANEARYAQGLGLWQQIVQQYAPGGSFGQGAMASYQQGKNKSMASGAQNLVSSGLYNSSTTAGMGARYEQDVGTPFRLNLADQQTQAETQALQGEAGFIERRTDQAPNAALFAQLQKGAANAHPTTYGSGFNDPSFGTNPFATATPRYANSNTGTTSTTSTVPSAADVTQTQIDPMAYAYNPTTGQPIATGGDYWSDPTAGGASYGGLSASYDPNAAGSYWANTPTFADTIGASVTGTPTNGGSTGDINKMLSDWGLPDMGGN